MKRPIKMPFGLNKDGRLVHIADVERGKKCDCVCSDCKAPLIANQGDFNRHYFSHESQDECKGGLESSIHRAAKQIIAERKKLTLPEYIVKVSKNDSKGIEQTETKTIVEHGTIIEFDSIETEKALLGIRPDLLGKYKTEQLIIEVLYRHKVDNEKLMKILNAKVSAIEISLSNLTDHDLEDWETFWSVINDPRRIRWLYNKRTIQGARNLEIDLEKKIRAQDAQYVNERNLIEKKAQKTRDEFIEALEELKRLSSHESILQLKQKATLHSFWTMNHQSLPASLEELPSFLNVDVPNGDWIFSCDRRIWQTAFYKGFFIDANPQLISIQLVDSWLSNQSDCKVPSCVETVMRLGRRNRQLIPKEILDNPPSRWRALIAYFNHLCTLGILRYFGDDSRVKGNHLYEIVGRR